MLTVWFGLQSCGMQRCSRQLPSEPLIAAIRAVSLRDCGRYFAPMRRHGESRNAKMNVPNESALKQVPQEEQDAEVNLM